jgi:ribosomal protein S12 methylthiotransferase
MKKYNQKTYFLASLGCAKNTVDSESMAILLNSAGYYPVDDPKKADVMIVNTCGFIHDARDESIQVLKDLSKWKRKNQVLLAAGCLPQRDAELITSSVPKIDGLLSTRRWMQIVGFIEQIRAKTSNHAVYNIPGEDQPISEPTGVLRAAVQGGSAYLKIADGCRRACAYCSIPIIKGPASSRSIEEILNDARRLEAAGVNELILIAQDTTDYGFDLGMKDGISVLLEKLVKEAPAIPWIRLMYTYPGFVTDRLIDLMASEKQILPYLDMPLQHAHPEVLKSMNRPADMDWVRRTLETMRSKIPNLALRTTVIVGYPTETDAYFSALNEFAREIRFDHLGAFTYSYEPGTRGAPLGDPIPEEVKDLRLQQLMETQEKISLEINQSFLGKEMQILIDGAGDGISVGRTYRDAPEVDGLVILKGESEVGKIVNARITQAMAHDFTAEFIN